MASQRAISGSAAREQIRHVRPRLNLGVAGRQFLRIAHRLSSADQDIVWRVLASLFSSAIDSAVAPSNCDVATLSSVGSSTLTQAVDIALPMASTFLLLFMTWKLYTVSRPLGASGGSVILIDVLGEVYELQQDTFASWEVSKIPP